MRLIFLALLAIVLAGCSTTPSTYSTNGIVPVAGGVRILTQHCYTDSNFYNLSNFDVPAVQLRLSNAGWTTTLKEDFFENNQCGESNGIRADDFFGTNGQFDAIYYSGHGYTGFNIFYDYARPSGCSSGGTICFGSSDYRLPFSDSRIKWILANASQNAQNTSSASWYSAFNHGSNGLHGYYGFQNEPSDNFSDNFGATFANAEMQSSGAASIRSAWVAAAQSNGSGSQYGIFELSSASQDVLSGPGSGQQVPYASNGQATVASGGNPVIYYSGSASQVNAVQLKSVDSTNYGTYYPITLTPAQTFSDSSIASTINQYETSNSSYASSNEFQISGRDFAATHYEASQALVMVGYSSTVPYGFTQSDANDFAIGLVSHYFPGGLPSDAVLSGVTTHYSDDGSGSGASILGYTFTWRHSDGRVEGDKIQVTVDSNPTGRTCDGYETDYNEITGRPYQVCTGFTETYAQHASYGYYLWRNQVATRHLLGYGGPGQPPDPQMATPQSIAAVVATESALKGSMTDLGYPTGYTFGYWSPGLASSDNTAYPCFNFYYQSGTVISADAHSGQVLGTSDGV